MSDLSELQERYAKFVAERDWEQFHTPKNAAEAVSIEAAELLELFQWHDNLDADRISEDEKLVSEVKAETADVVIYCLSLANQLDYDLTQAVAEKLEDDESRFDMETAQEITERLQPKQRRESGQ